MSKLVIANWKMNFSLKQAIEYCDFVKDQPYEELILAVPAPYLAYLSSNFPTIRFASQNVSHLEEYGSFTGEYSAKMLKSCGINYAIIGHCERRDIFSENDSEITAKAMNCIITGITPIICIGETSQMRSSGRYIELITSSVDSLLENITAVNGSVDLYLAYEPVWAVGNNVVVTKKDIEEVLVAIKDTIQNKIAINVKIVYGGSVSISSVTEILSCNILDGILVSRSGLNLTVLRELINLVRYI